MKEKMLWLMAALIVFAACGGQEAASADGSSEGETYYKKGYDSDRKMQHRMAEYYWKAAMASTSTVESRLTPPAPAATCGMIRHRS